MPAATYLRDPLGQSDHAEQTRAGIPAAWLEWRDDRCWHAACDRVARLDARKLQAAIDATVRAADEVLG